MRFSTNQAFGRRCNERRGRRRDRRRRRDDPARARRAPRARRDARRFRVARARGAVRFRGDAARRASPHQSEALRGYDVVFFAGGEDASERYAPALVERGSVVIDNSATFRMRARRTAHRPRGQRRRAARRTPAVPGCELHGDRAVHGAAPDSRRRRFAHACASRRIKRRAAPAAPDSTSCSQASARCAAGTRSRRLRSSRVRWRATSFPQVGSFDARRMEQRGAQDPRRDAQDARPAGPRRQP